MDYLPDESAGAVINATPIRNAIHKAMAESYGVFHIHEHSHYGTPRFSLTDLTSLNELLPALKAVAPSAPHGGFLLSKNGFFAKIWLPENVVLNSENLVFEKSSAGRKTYER